MKRIIFLIIGAILVLGLVLPGCGTPTPPGPTLTPTTMTFDKGGVNNTVVVGIPGEYTHATGGMAYLGAVVAQSQINVGGILIKDATNATHAYNLTIKFVETGEATVDPTGTAGVTAMNTYKSQVDFFAGGFRTEAVDKYRDVVMKNDGTGMIFYDCGAATEALCHSVVTDYPHYRFFFKGTPYNEYFLGTSVVKCVDAVAKAIRTAAGLNATCALNACIVADNLEWAMDQAPLISSELASIHVNLSHAIIWVDPTAADAGVEMSGVLQNQVAPSHPVIIIPVLSSNAGIYYDIYRNVWVPNAMSVGINVLSQLKTPWVTKLSNPPGANQTYNAYEVELDTWAFGTNMTSKTYGFLATWAAYFGATHGGFVEYPLYTAATYDVMWTMKAGIEACAFYNTTSGVATCDADTLIQWLENPANAQLSTTGKAQFYPKWDGTTLCSGKPALTSAQVAALYPSATYSVCDWAMPGHTTHDLVYGPGYLTGLGAQWQWTGAVWEKHGVWPMVVAGGATDQYGDWSFAYAGTSALVIPPNVSGNATCN